MKSSFAAGCVAATVAFGAGGLVSSAVSASDTTPNPDPHPNMVSAVQGSDVVVSGCVIRFSDPDGYPTIHANGTHMCAGYSGLHINEHGEIALTQTVRGGGTNPVLFGMCQADERVGGRLGIICGMSGGTDESRYALYDTRLNRQLDLNDKSDRMRVQHRLSNLWVGGIHVPNGWDRYGDDAPGERAANAPVE